MLVSFRSGPVNTTLWDPKAKQIFSSCCRPSCLVCRILGKLINIVVRLYHFHRTKNQD